MINRNSFYKNGNIYPNNTRERLKEYFNPYEYNFESNIKDRENSDIICQKSKCHNSKKIVKK